MKSWVFKVPIILLLLLAAPHVSKAEGIGTTLKGTLQGVTGNLKQETNGLLNDTVKETSATVGLHLQESVHLEKVVEEAVPKEKAAVSRGKVDEAVKQTSKAVQKTVESTKPVSKPTVKTARETVKTAVSTTTKDTGAIAETAEKTAKTLEEATDHAVEKLPAIPVVKAVVEAVHKENKEVAGLIERKVTGAVERTVQKPVEQVVDRIEQTTRQTVEPKLEQTTEPAESVLKPRSDTPRSASVEPGAQDGIEQSSVPEHEAVMEEKLASYGTVEQGEGPEMVSAVQMKKMQDLAEREPADTLLEATTKADTYASLAKQSVLRATKILSGQNEKSKVLLTKPLEMTLAAPVANGPVHTSSANGGVHDVALGVLTRLENLSLTMGNGWIKGNQFALKQWIYDPLGQPPKSSPFFN